MKIKSIVLFYLMLLLLTNYACAQKSINWIGGFPGRETDWFCSKNWNTGNVPDEFSDVIIPIAYPSFHFNPVIHEGMVCVRSLTISSGAALKIDQSAKLISDFPIVGHIRYINTYPVMIAKN